MQLRDDTKAKEFIGYIEEHKPKCRGVLTDMAKKTGLSHTHVINAAKGKVPYNIQNFRLLRMIADRVAELIREMDAEIIPLVPEVDTQQRA